MIGLISDVFGFHKKVILYSLSKITDLEQDLLLWKQVAQLPPPIVARRSGNYPPIVAQNPETIPHSRSKNFVLGFSFKIPNFRRLGFASPFFIYFSYAKFFQAFFEVCF